MNVFILSGNLAWYILVNIDSKPPHLLLPLLQLLLIDVSDAVSIFILLLKMHVKVFHLGEVSGAVLLTLALEVGYELDRCQQLVDVLLFYYLLVYVDCRSIELLKRVGVDLLLHAHARSVDHLFVDGCFDEDFVYGLASRYVELLQDAVVEVGIVGTLPGLSRKLISLH